jgi:NAD(P)-dependent dehydrogenase (short-subunit alcohol dehydrogenase family)
MEIDGNTRGKEQDMNSKQAVILGGTSGIGLAAARQLLGRGMEVTITGRDTERLEAARQSLEGRARVSSVDGTNGKDVQAFFSSLGGFDHLILAFGSRRGSGPLASVSPDEVRQGFEEKVFPHIACAQAALPYLRKSGSITFLSAVSGQASMPGTAGIGAANAAVAALVPILAAELKPLRVNAVSPGVIDTPWWNFLTEEQKAQAFAGFAATTPVGRIGRPEDVADAIAFLVFNTFMTGHVLICDGGARLGT